MNREMRHKSCYAHKLRGITDHPPPFSALRVRSAAGTGLDWRNPSKNARDTNHKGTNAADWQQELTMKRFLFVATTIAMGLVLVAGHANAQTKGGAKGGAPAGGGAKGGATSTRAPSGPITSKGTGGVQTGK